MCELEDLNKKIDLLQDQIRRISIVKLLVLPNWAIGSMHFCNQILAVLFFFSRIDKL